MARVQRIESDSAFSRANVLNGTILTYKTFQNGRVVHKAKLSNGSVVEITPKVQFSDSISLFNYYTKDEVDAMVQGLSNSIQAVRDTFSNYYNKGAIDAFIGDLSNSLASLQSRVVILQNNSGAAGGAGVSLVVFSEIDQQGYANFTGYGIPIGVIAPSGAYYPIQKLSLLMNTSTGVARIHMAPYLAYQNAQSFSGVWICCFPKAANLLIVVSQDQPSNPVDGTIWIQDEQE